MCAQKLTQVNLIYLTEPTDMLSQKFGEQYRESVESVLGKKKKATVE